MTWRQERGYAALALVALLSLVGAAFLARALTLSTTRQDLREARFTRIALREAREALIAKAALEDNTPGALLCPDSSTTTNDTGYGQANSCGDAGNSGEAMGCVPWKTLGIPPASLYGLTPLWYVMSADLRSASFGARDRITATRQINPGNQGQLTLVNMDTGITEPIMAAIIAPGPALATQARADGDSCSPLQAATYLDTASSGAAGTVSNAERVLRIAQGARSGTFNDVVMPIKRDEIMRQVIPNVLQALSTTPLATGGIPSPGRTLAFVRGDTLGAQARYDDALWSIWPRGTDLANPPEPTDCNSGTLADIEYRCVGTRVAAGGNTINEYCFTPASPRATAAWLCFNRWYDYVSYSVGVDGGATLTASAGTTRCALRMNGVTATLACDDSEQ
ncbi:MAG: hypothetical protein QM639_04700 [Rhodocyclaceae bacterium]